MGATISFPAGKGYELKPKEAKKCAQLASNKWPGAGGDVRTTRKEEKRLVGLSVLHAEVVVHIRVSKSRQRRRQRRSPAEADADTGTELPDETLVKRAFRNALVTRGTIQIIAKNRTLLDSIKSHPNAVVGLREIKSVSFYESHNLVVVEAEIAQYTERGNTESVRVMYLTPDPRRLMEPLATSAAFSYIGCPVWAIPLKWSLGSRFPLASISPSYHKKWLGVDGGFSTSFFAAIEATIIRLGGIRKVFYEQMIRKGANGISGLILSQQRETKSSLMHIDVVQLAKDICGICGTRETTDMLATTQNTLKGRSTKSIVTSIIVEALRCLAFNLVFRKLKLNSVNISSPLFFERFRTSLLQIATFNVTLRELDLEGTKLDGMGEQLGQALIYNPRPFISRLNIESCNISDKDFRGLALGLVRMWCGGTAILESLSLGRNPRVSPTSWQLFFDAFGPSSAPTPRPPLGYLQHLGLRGTNAVECSSSLANFIKELSGLRSIDLTCAGNLPSDTNAVLEALSCLDAPLESFSGEGLTSSPELVSALFRHGRTLKRIHLENFQSDATPLLVMWPEAVPKLHLTFKGNLASATVTAPLQTQFSPGSLEISNDNGNSFCTSMLDVICMEGSGTHSLFLNGVLGYHVSYISTDNALRIALNGLKVLHVIYGRSYINDSAGAGRNFWSILSMSKTLEDLQAMNQFFDNSDNGIEHLGQFLKTNRSVRTIGCDGPNFTMTAEGSKALRSAFYGNKKVVSMELPDRAIQKAMDKHAQTVRTCAEEVNVCKRQIKQLFKSSYSKYDPNWRARPNRLKMPYVERIRVAKRSIGASTRGTKKMGQQFDAIKHCLTENRTVHDQQQAMKVTPKIERRSPQLQRLASKKQKVLTKMSTRIHKAKKHSRKTNAARARVARSEYYKHRSLWTKRRRSWSLEWPFLFELEEDQDRQSGNDYSDQGQQHMLPPPFPLLNAMETADEAAGDAVHREVWDNLLPSCNVEAILSDDPWENMDSLMDNAETILTPDRLSDLHAEASELGADILADIAPALDEGAAINAQIGSIAEAVGASATEMNNIVNAMVAENGFDLDDLNNDLGDIPEFDIVEMYAGAGPRDLDDGGPSFGKESTAVLSGCRRRVRAKDRLRALQSNRTLSGPQMFRGYKQIDFRLGGRKPSKMIAAPWGDNLEKLWSHMASEAAIEEMSKSDSFPFPEVANHRGKRILEWSSTPQQQKSESLTIEVVLVTQCSMDRLLNLKEQLKRWNGKASVAIYVEGGVKISEAESLVLSCIEEARHDAIEDANRGTRLDVAVSLFHVTDDMEKYPINFLRNAALIEARRQQVVHGTLKRGAVLLADVDFCPSKNLKEELHCEEAASSILDRKRVVVCPAFEVIGDRSVMPTSMPELKRHVHDGTAEGFHTSQFPPGHSPTCYERFWETSQESKGSIWNHLYQIDYEEYFEPYIVMATTDVPFYDERFQGYGLNKVSHLATVARLQSRFHVLPGVFLAAPVHQRSDQWRSIYGSTSDEARYNQLWLKGLYRNFNRRLQDGLAPAISPQTRTLQNELSQQSVKKDPCSKAPDQSKVMCSKRAIIFPDGAMVGPFGASTPATDLAVKALNSMLVGRV